MPCRCEFRRPGSFSRAVLAAVLVGSSLASALADGGGVELPAPPAEAAASAAAASALRVRQPDPLDGLPIVRIVFVRNDIFDTEEPGTTAWFYHLANNLHVTSTERFLRRMLLFTEGDAYHAFEAEESARILRSTKLVTPVYITAREVLGGVEVTVDTRERWSLEVGAKFGLSGNRSHFAISFDEKNILGNGQAVNIKYSSDDERTSWTYGLYDPNILGSRIRARVEYEDASDGYGRLVNVDFPFYSLATPRAWGLRWEDSRHQSYLYSESEEVVQGTAQVEDIQVWGGIRLPGRRDLTQRLTLGYVSRTEAYADWAWEDGSGSFQAPDPLELGGIRVGYELVLDHFLVLRGFRSWVSQEDVAMGPNLAVGLTQSLPALGGDIPRTLFDGSFSVTRQLGDWMLLTELWSAGRVDDGSLRDAVLGCQVVFSQLGDKAWLARLLVEDGYELDRDRQLALGADLGLRGWDPDHFDGTGRAVANLQWRLKLKDDIAHLFSLGMVAFVDGGTTWGARVGAGSDRVHGDIGVGLVADVPQIGLVKLLRLEVALPDDGSGYTAIVTTSSLF